MSKQAIGDAVGLRLEKRARRREQARRELRCCEPAAAARSKREVGQTQFQRHPIGGEAFLAQPGRDAIALDEQDARELRLVG